MILHFRWMHPLLLHQLMPKALRRTFNKLAVQYLRYSASSACQRVEYSTQRSDWMCVEVIECVSKWLNVCRSDWMCAEVKWLNVCRSDWSVPKWLNMCRSDGMCAEVIEVCRSDWMCAEVIECAQAQRYIRDLVSANGTSLYFILLKISFFI